MRTRIRLALAITIVFVVPAALRAACEECWEDTVTCGSVRAESWAYHAEVLEECDGEPDSKLVDVHIFPALGYCEGVDPPDDCVACGNQSECHIEYWMSGGCHEDCPPNLFASLVEDIDTAVAHRNVGRIAALVHRGDVRFDPIPSRLELVISCAREAHRTDWILTSDVAAALRLELRRLTD